MLKIEGEKMYSELIQNLVEENNINIKGYRNNLSGVAYIDERSIIIPRPTTKMRLSICLHEIGHIVLKHNRSKKRFVEEKEAWDYALTYMKENKIPITKKLRFKRYKAIEWAIHKAMKRGLKNKVSDNIFYIEKVKMVRREK